MKNILSTILLAGIAIFFTACSGSRTVAKKDAYQIDQGYGTIDAKSKTTAVSQVEVDERVNVTWYELLQKHSGVNVQGTGNNLSITIRGPKSMNAPGQPLFVVDGQILGEGFYSVAHIDPNMVQRISVLKDAASSAAYGSRGANGVILVTLRKS